MWSVDDNYTEQGSVWFHRTMVALYNCSYLCLPLKPFSSFQCMCVCTCVTYSSARFYVSFYILFTFYSCWLGGLCNILHDNRLKQRSAGCFLATVIILLLLETVCDSWQPFSLPEHIAAMLRWAPTRATAAEFTASRTVFSLYSKSSSGITLVSLCGAGDSRGRTDVLKRLSVSDWKEEWMRAAALFQMTAGTKLHFRDHRVIWLVCEGMRQHVVH